MPDCNPASFQARSFETLSDLQRIAYLHQLTEEEFNTRSASAEASGQYQYIGGAGSWNEFIQRLALKKEETRFNSYRSYHRTWASSALTDGGVTAYIQCLRGGVGLYLTVTSLSSSSAKVTFGWYPGPAGDVRAPALITDHKNVKNISEIRQALGRRHLGSRQRELPFVLEKRNANKEAYLTVNAGGLVGDVAYIPPADVVHLPPPPTFVIMAQYYEVADNLITKLGGEFVASANPQVGTNVTYRFDTAAEVVGPAGQLGNLPFGRYAVEVEYASLEGVEDVVFEAGGYREEVTFPATGGEGMGHRAVVPVNLAFTGANPELRVASARGFPDLRLFIFRPVTG